MYIMRSKQIELYIMRCYFYEGNILHGMRNVAQRSAKSVRCATVRSRIFVRAGVSFIAPSIIDDRIAWHAKKFQWRITMTKYVALNPAAWLTLPRTGLLCYRKRGDTKRDGELVASVHHPIERHYQLAESDSLPVHRQRCIAGWKPP